MYTQDDLNSYAESNLKSSPGSGFWGPAVGVGLPVTAFALGFARTKSGGRVWDVYFKALQHMEGALPMGIGATFRLSEMVSPFASPREFTLSPTDHPELFGKIRADGRVSSASRGFEDYLSRTTGVSIHRLRAQGAFEKGITWTRTGKEGAFLGSLSVTGGPVLSSNVAALSTGPRRAGHMLEWFGRVSGVSNAGFLKGLEETGDYLRPTLMPAAAVGSKLSLFGKGLYSIFSAGVGRMNTLLASPSELPVIQDIVRSVPLLGKLDLSIKPGPGMEMLSRYAGKAAIGLGIYHGIRYADYLGREYGPAASIPIGAATGGLAGLWLGLRKGRASKYGLIGAAIGGVAGGLLGGPISGAAEVYSQADILRAQVSDVTGLTGGARRAEDFFPGTTEPITLVGAAGVGLLLGGVSDYYQRLAVTRAIGKKRGTSWGPAHQRVKDIYEAAEGQIKDAAEKQYRTFGELAEKTSGLSKFFTRIRQRFAGFMQEGKFNPSLRAGKGALLGAATFAGLSIAGSLLSGDIGGVGLTAASAAGAAALYPKMGVTGAALALAVPFLLRGKTPSEQLERIYSGEEEVPVKSGRFWEMGRSSFEGRRPYYRPSRIAMMKKGGVQETALYGDESKFWETDPILHPLRFLMDPYAREKLMWQQGYRFPMSKTPFEDFPIVGPILAASFGQVIKPPKFIGREEWLNDPEVEGGIPEGWDSKPLPEPISRTGIKGTIGEQAYRMTELMGLWGFTAQSIKGALTGNESWFPESQWATPSLVSGVEPGWWSLELGGLAMSSELIRRFIPHKRCLLPGTLIKTPIRYVPVEDISIGEEVIDINGDRAVVLEKTQRFVSEEISSIKTYYNNETLNLTKDHKVFAVRLKHCTTRGIGRNLPCWGANGKECSDCPYREDPIPAPGWIPAGELTPLDFVQLPQSLVLEERSILDMRSVLPELEVNGGWARCVQLVPGKCGSTRRSYSKTKIATQIELGFDFGWLLGLYAAEGNTDPRGYVCFSLARTEGYLADRVEAILRGLVDFGECKGFFRESLWETRPNKENGLVLRCACKPLAQLVRKLIPGVATNKTASEFVRHASREFFLGLLLGYLEGDGCVSLEKGKGLRIIASSASRDLADFIFEIGLLLGCLPSRSKGREASKMAQKSGQDHWRFRVEFSGSEAVNLARQLSRDNGKSREVTPKQKTRRVIRTGQGIFIGVKEVSLSAYRGVVHNLEVTKTNSYGTNICTVHNSELEYRNPLPSGLPSWLPGPDSMYFLDFSRADVYSKIKEPWARLPGAGYSAIHPELKGIAPEEYPDYWRFKILCLDPLTRIYTSRGVKEIRYIEPGDFVFGQDGKLKEVIAKETKPSDGPAYSIRTFYNNDCPLVCSPEHRILVAKRDGTICELKASELTREHYLLFPKRESLGGNDFLCIGNYCDVKDVDLKYEEEEYWAHVKGSQRHLKFNLPTSYEMGRVFGLYLAEGCANIGSQQVIWCFHQDEVETLAKEIKIFAEAVGLQWYERFMTNSLGYQITINNKLLARFLIQVFGHGASDKHIGLNLAQFPPEFSLGIVDGYLDGDGNIAVAGNSITLRASSISRELLEQCRLVLGFLGITAAIRLRKGNYREQGFGSRGSVIHDCWTLDIRRSDICKLPAYRDVDLSDYKYQADPDSKKYGFETERYVAFRVKEVLEITSPSEWVDIAIDDPSGSNCFVTTCGLVHNSDLAPWSREYGQYDKMMSRMWADQRLTAKQILDIQTTRRQVDETKKAKEFEQYRYDNQATEQRTVRITGEVSPGYYLTDTFGSAPISLAGLDTSTPALANIAMRENAALTAKEAMNVGVRKRSSMARYLREQLRPGAEVQVSINRDRSALMQHGPGDQPVVPAVISVGGQSLNRQLVEMGLAEEQGGSQILDPMAATGVVQRAVGSFWENLMHGAETPLESLTPLAPIAKFVHQRTPLEEYQRSEVYGRDVALWQKPVSHFLAPGLATTAWWGGWRGIPQDVQERYMVEEYFDRLEYMKWKRLENAARMAGEGRAAATYAGRASRTATGVDPTSTRSAYLSLAKYERMYFEEFVRSPTGAERREISKIVSPQFNKILHAQWAKREAEQAQMRAKAGISRVEDPSLISNFEAMRSSQAVQQREQENAQAGAEMPVPGPTWVGWCVPPTQILLDSSSRPILAGEISLGVQLYLGGTKNPVERVHRRRTKENVYRIQTGDNAVDSLTVTEDHLVLVSRAEASPSYISAKEIDPSRDWLVLRRYIPDNQPRIIDLALLPGNADKEFDDQFIWPRFVGRNRLKASRCPRFLRVTPDLCWLLGYYAAEGCLGYRKGRARRVDLTQSLEETSLLEKVLSIYRSMGLAPKVYERHRDRGNSRNILVNNQAFAELIRTLIPGTCQSKNLTDLSLLWNYECIRSFLLGVFHGDGGKTSPIATCLAVASRALVTQCRTLLFSLGIRCGTYPVNRANRRPKYGLSIPVRDESLSFVEQVLYFSNTSARVPLNYKRSRSDAIRIPDPRFVLLKISEIIVSEYEGEVYDFSMGTMAEYSSPVGIVHNSGHTEMEDFKVKTVAAEGMDLARYGVWPSDLRKIAQKPWVEPISSGFAGNSGQVLSPTGVRRRFRGRTNSLGSRGPSLVPLSDETVRMEFESPGRDRLNRYLQDPSILTF